MTMAENAGDEEWIKSLEEKYVKTYFSLMDTIKQIEYHKGRLIKTGFGTLIILLILFGFMTAGVFYIQKAERDSFKKSKPIKLTKEQKRINRKLKEVFEQSLINKLNSDKKSLLYKR